MSFPHLLIIKQEANKIIEDDPAVYNGAPVGVQIVCRRYEEEKVWAIAKIVDTILKSSNDSA